MKIEDQKLEIIEWLIHVDDRAILNQIDFLRKPDEEKWASLSDEEQKAIEEGLHELNEGQGIPHHDVIADLRQRYTS
jgi:hypothetical protein